MILLREALRSGFPKWEPDATYYARTVTRLNAMEANCNGEILVLIENQSPVALTWFELNTYPKNFDGEHDSEPWPELRGVKGAQFRLTGVVPTARRRGYAKSLKRVAEQKARLGGASFLYSRCSKHNLPMLELNQSLGYELIPEDGPFIRLRKLMMS
jgi:GNAT superfamily N-acetyltransferase